MYDVIVLGIGSMGSSALYQLAKRGVKVLGIEQFGIGHSFGSHSGKTRIIRKAYFEHPDYVPLLENAYEGWRLIEKETNKKLFHTVGLTYFGEPDHPVMRGIKDSAELYDIELERREADKEHDPFIIPNAFENILEQDAGFVIADEAIRTFTNQAQLSGAEIRIGEEVLDWRLVDGLVEVRTKQALYRAKKLILTAGAYTNQLIPEFSGHLTITRQLLAWVKPKNPKLFTYGRLPCWVIADKEYPGIIYGFPSLSVDEFEGSGLVKIGHHAPGEKISPENLHDYDPEIEKQKLAKMMTKYFGDNLGEIVSLSECMYTNTPDEHFVIDYLPGSGKRIVFASGFSGHGFKFTPVIGDVLANLSLKGETDYPIDFLSISRF